ncbi:hypothetical protein CW749_14380 [Vibrio sp. vnigr-6D03]|uniref:response regulator receiver domain n=1 Tax=Vibrio sp. vnigr-6D03 TaxID=2058088 RepID=UPI000C32F64B|nr:response regulator receiver domain [Vibrio sp. vnigr-6D03]PKF78898.1 hypothetical protein CW749_14380 [Vibrio sp. vnigr-6D03]
MPNYNGKVVSAFRNDAIKSVILIDDDYIPYEEIIDINNENNNKIDQCLIGLRSGDIEVDQYREKLNELKFSLKQSGVAREVKEYFNDLSIVCDVEKTTKDISADKIRKSDLIVLDYQLEDKDPTQALDLIYKLSTNSHMNIVVVYTNNNLDQTWLEIASCLRGSYNGDPDDYSITEGWDDKWNDFVDDNSPENWNPSDSAKADFLVSGNENKIKGEISRLLKNKGKFPELEILKCYLETVVSKHNKLKTDFNPTSSIQGDFDNKECQWLISGNVFITLLQKNESENNQLGIPKAEQIWSQVEKALCHWGPSLYRVVASELQNKIEDGRFSFEAGHSSDHKREAALLWHLINNHKDNINVAAENLLDHMLQDFSHDLLKERDLVNFIKETANHVTKDAKPHVEFEKGNEEQHKEYLLSLFEIAFSNTNRGNDKLNDAYHSDVIHTLNEELSTYKTLPKFVTTGLVMVDQDDPQSWYLCVTPSCNSVPGQVSDLASKKMTPHRNHTLLKLEKFTKYKEKLECATHSKFIFVTHETQKIALGVLDSNTNLPKIEKVVVMHHDDQPLEVDGKQVSFHSVSGSKLEYTTKKLIPVKMLRPIYAARFQNFQSHYEGRIGVDYVDLKI